MSDKLKPCPFCGNLPQLFENGKLVCCESLICNGNQFPMMLYTWQSRPAEEKLLVENERLRVSLLDMITLIQEHGSTHMKAHWTRIRNAMITLHT